MRDSTRGCAAWFKASFSRDNRAFTAVLIAVLVLGAVLRFSRLTFQSLWLDELHSLLCSRPDVPLQQLLRSFARGGVSHPPLYFVGLHAWFGLFGFSEWSARAFSAVGGVLGLVSLYYLGKEARGRTCGLVACLLGLFNYFHVYYSQEARPYVWMFFLGACSLAFLVRHLRRGGVRSLVGYVVVATLTMLTHYYGLILTAAQLLAAGLWILATAEGRQRWRKLCVMAVAALLLCGLYAPQGLVVLRTISRKRYSWIETPTVAECFRILYEFMGKDRLLAPACAVLCLTALLAFVRSSGRSAGRRDDALRVSVPVFAGVVFFCLLLPCVISVVWTPMLLARYAIILLPALLALMAVGVTVLRHRAVIAAVTAGLVCVSAFRLFSGRQYYTRVKKEQWREAAQHVIAASETLHPGQHVLYYSRQKRRYQLYMELLGAEGPVRYARERNLSRRLEETPGSVDGVWVLRGHGSVESTGFLDLLNRHFSSVHRREWKEASAEFYVPTRRPGDGTRKRVMDGSADGDRKPID